MSRDFSPTLFCRGIPLAACALIAALCLSSCGGSSPDRGDGVSPKLGPAYSDWDRWTPPVITKNQADPVLYETAISGNPGGSVVLTINGIGYPLYDNGTHGDKLAGDGIWTVQLPAQVVLARDAPAYVHRPYIGALTLGGTSSVFNVFAEIRSPDMDKQLIYPVKGGGQETNYVVNYTVTSAQLLSFDPALWAQRFYMTHPDEFDFLNFVLVSGRRGNRYHFAVKNTVRGIGLPGLDISSSYGSGGRLIGISVFPISMLFDHGSLGFLHETAHQWANFLDGTPYAPSSPHWPAGNISTNVVGLSIPGSNVGGQYPYNFIPYGSDYLVLAGEPMAPHTFNLMELYLMGLADAIEVPDFFILKDQSQAFNLQPGSILKAGDVQTVSLADVVSVVGPRVPDAATSQKKFRSATIVLSEDSLDGNAMDLYDFFARRAEAVDVLDCSSGLAQGRCNPWFLATDKRSVMESRIRN